MYKYSRYLIVYITYIFAPSGLRRRAHRAVGGARQSQKTLGWREIHEGTAPDSLRQDQQEGIEGHGKDLWTFNLIIGSYISIFTMAGGNHEEMCAVLHVNRKKHDIE